MSCRVVVDNGNSLCKVAVFDEGELIDSQVLEAVSGDFLTRFVGGYDVEAAIVGSSGGDSAQIASWLRDGGVRRVVEFDASVPTPLKNCYATPQTLGVDRLAVAVGAADVISGRDLIVFDFGTAITIDFVSAKGEFKGGNISPGLAMRFAALHNQTQRLPLVEGGDWNRDSRAFGRSTSEAIYRGVVNGICHEVEGYIDENPEKTVFFTGGDALFFEKQIKKPIFVDSQLSLRGLRVILNRCLDE